METLKKQAAKLLGEQKKYRRWMAVFLCLAVVVMAGTTAALKMNGQALSHEKKVLACGEEVHVHTAECYGSGIIPALVEGENALDREQPVCGYADYVVHVHGEGCFDEDGTLVCLLPEKAPHVHTESCFSKQMLLVCGQEETEIHQHTEVCRELICGQEETEVREHQHTEACKALICGQEESEGHQHTEACRTVTWGELICEDTEEGHEHTAECYEQIEDITCGMEESEGHTHTEECYDMQACGQEEGIEGHTHTEECYGPYICGFGEESEGHVHTDACYQVKEVLVCGELELHTHTEECCDAEGNLICGLPELKEHVHGEECFEIIRVENEEEAETKLFQKVYEDADIRVIAEYTAEANIPEEAELVAERVDSAADSLEESKEAAAESTAESAGPAGEINEVAEVQEPETSESEADVQETDTTGSEDASAADNASEAGMEVVEEKVSYRLKFLVDGTEIEPEGTVSFIVQGLDGNGNDSGELVTLMYKAGDGLDAMVVTLTAQYKNAAIETEENVPSISENPEENDDTTVDDGQVIKKVYADSNVRVEAVYGEAANIPEEAELTVRCEGKETDAVEENIASEENKASAEENEVTGRDAAIAETDKKLQTVREMTVKVGFSVDGEDVVPEDTVIFTIQMLDEEGNAIGEPEVLVYEAGSSLDTLTAILRETVDKVFNRDMKLTQIAETENYIVTVSYSENAEIPEEAQLRVIEYTKDSERYEQRCAELGYQPDWLLNIGFFAGEVEVEPKAPVSVKVTEKGMTEAADYEIVHFGENETEQLNGNGIQTDNGVETEFMLDSFSDVAGFSIQSVEFGDQVGEVAPIGDLVHEKKVEPTGVEGVYELTLNVMGSVAGGDEKAKLDIVFVVDTSGSMAWNVNGNSATSLNPSRRTLANTAISNLINDLDAADSGIDAQYKLITFSNSANTANARNWQSGSTLQNRLPGSASGGTNYEDALEKAGSAVASHRDGSKTIVIFLTDGAPTYYNNGYGNGGTGNSTTVATVDGAVRGAGHITCDYFFAVGFGAEMTKNTTVGSSGKTAYEILEAVAEATNAGGKNASATTDLTKYFESFKESLKRILATDVVFTDKLTNEVSIVDESGNPVTDPGAGNWEVEIKDAEGNILPEGHQEYIDAGMSVTYDSANGLRVAFKDGYILRQDYTYAVKTKIAPNEAAETKYADNGYMYTETGDANTGSQSSNRQGIRCNQEGSAAVSYSYIVNGEKREREPAIAYPYPVVQLTENLEPPAIVDQEMTHDKYIQKVDGENDVYDLTLDLTGRVGSTTKPAYYDILFIVDESTSMTNKTTITADVVDYNNKICTKEEHTHSIGSCYELNCNKEEHSHGFGCIFGCSKEAHSHSVANNCYRLICDKEAHQHTGSCYGTKPGGTQTVTRMEAAKIAVKSLIKSVEGNEKIIANYNVIGFGQDATSTGWLDNPDTVTGNVDSGLSANSSYTNYGAALAEAKTQLDSAPEPLDTSENNRAVKFVIFLTDGVPAPSGTDNPSKAYYENALTNAGKIMCDYFYAVGLGMDNKSYTITGYQPGLSKTPREILEDVVARVAATYKDVKEGKDGTELNALFSDFAGILTELRCHDVTVTDILSQYVEVNNTETPAKLTIRIADFEAGVDIASAEGNVTSGVSVVAPKSEKNDSDDETTRTITASYDSVNRKIELDFPYNYKLESKYKYYVTVQIRPTKAAYEAAEALPKDADGNVIYPNEGGAGTDAPGVTDKISEGVKGLFTNAGATVTFRYDDDVDQGDEETEIYERPVIRVDQAKLAIKKTVTGLTLEETAELFANMYFIIDGDTRNPVTASALVDKRTENGKVSYALKEGVGTANEDGSVTYVILTGKELIPGNHTVTEVWDAAEVDGYIRTSSYKVNDGAVSGTTTESGNINAEVNVKANQSETVEFINSYVQRTATIQLKKVDENNSSEPFQGLQFSIMEGKLPAYTETVTNPDGTPEEAERPMTEEELQKEIKSLKENAMVATFEIDVNGDAILKSVIAKYQDSNSDNIGTKNLKLPVGDYTVVEDRTVDVPLTNYAEVYPFEIKVLANGNVEKNDILGYPNGENATIASVDGETYKLTVVNRQMELAELQILKVSAQNGGIALKGAEFSLYEVTREDGDELEGRILAEKLQSGEDGIITSDVLKNLKAGGRYYLVETKAPDGYMLSTNKIRFNIVVERDVHEGNLVKVTLPQDTGAYIATIDSDGNYKRYDAADKDSMPYWIDEDGNQIWTLAVTNNTGKELPVTGGPGTAMYTLGGLAVIATSLVYGLSMRRKKKKGGSN